MKQSVNLLVICGPNASGKTHLGVILAQKTGGEIISADSRQVYRGMDIGTGKEISEYTTPQGAVPFHLIDIVEPDEIYTIYHYQKDFYRVFREIQARKKLPLLVGGTGLYIEAVLKYYRIPNVPENELLRKELMKKDTRSLLEQLYTFDSAQVEKTDTSSKKRIVRAIEIAMYAQDHEIEWGCSNPPEIVPLVLGIQWDRQKLRQRIDKRLNDRLKEGMIDEVGGLMKKGISSHRFSLFGMEYKFIAQYLTGKLSYDDMVKGLRNAICQLAKRQETWFRGMERRGVPVHWIHEADPGEAFKIIEKHTFIY
ncbi:MAG: tRNA (adenosine(37)-N6)-dimethylallyltransferase MiaA [Chitinivibrionales bacterium]|nr:tRNA (adenosine(37)-N6)-dimethylallyltransferase MiaA [Chitinivibrionales bacterium]